MGETVKIKGVNFTVIGVTKAKGDQGWFNPDEMVVVPYLAAMKQLFGQDYLSEIDVKVTEHWYYAVIGNGHCTDMEGLGWTPQ